LMMVDFVKQMVGVSMIVDSSSSSSISFSGNSG